MVNENNIEIGDKVYVGGLFGRIYKGLNNKVGTIKNVTFTSTEMYATYVADVLIEGDTLPMPINLVYLFDLRDFDSINYDAHLTDPLNPLTYFYNRHRVDTDQHPMLTFDEYGKSMIMCITRENKFQPFYLTGLN